MRRTVTKGVRYMETKSHEYEPNEPSNGSTVSAEPPPPSPSASASAFLAS